MTYASPSQELLDCMDLCGECASICARCSHHCLDMGGEHASPKHQGVMRDCAEICSTAVCFMARDSDFSSELCGVCAQVCEACADSCERLGKNDKMMQQCAETCRRCAEACGKMAGAHA